MRCSASAPGGGGVDAWRPPRHLLSRADADCRNNSELSDAFAADDVATAVIARLPLSLAVRQPNPTQCYLPASQQICFTLDARLNQHQNLDLGLSLETKRLSSVSMPEFWFRLRHGGHNFGLGLSPGQNIGLRLGLERLVSRLTSLVAVVAALVCPCRSQYG